ncbi:hypothetical protein H7J83_08605 [Mycobacterium mantenii]|nr:hypothetical protein [Mycobacterium mantenii]MCV7242806.1 hypothetical protein [Mycobacterium mantenii]
MTEHRGGYLTWLRDRRCLRCGTQLQHVISRRRLMCGRCWALVVSQ